MPDLDFPTPAFTPLIPPEAMQAETVPVIEGKRLSERCDCGHFRTEHGRRNMGCGVANCPCGNEWGRA
jgi:hypothetical protein